MQTQINSSQDSNFVHSNSFDKISPTALMVAYARQFTDIPYCKELSELVNAEAVVEQLEAIVEKLQQHKSVRPVEAAMLIEARYKAIDRAIAMFPTTQIMELASGLLPRGMVMSAKPNNVFIESDLPNMISRKQKLVQQLVSDHRSNLYFLPIDATSQPSKFPLKVDYLDPQKPVNIVCEGLLMYLTVKQKQQVFANVREFLKVYSGVWITYDLATKEDLRKRWRINPAWLQFEQAINQMTARSQTDTTFDNFEEVRQFVSEQGFEVQPHSMLDVLDQITCLQPLGIDPAIAESVLAHSSIFVLTLRDF